MILPAVTLTVTSRPETLDELVAAELYSLVRS